MKLALLTGCNDKHYQLGLLSGLVPGDIEVDFIANDDMKDAALCKNVHYYNIRGDQDPKAPFGRKVFRILRYYLDLIRYAARSDAEVFHIQWLNKFHLFDRTLLNLYYKALGKKLVFTAHNINDRDRDGNDTLVNRLSLKFMYTLMDHIIVHTDRMKRQLMQEFGVAERKISVIPHGIHDAIYQSDMTREDARKRLCLGDEKMVLFFGNVAPYKGVEYAVMALDKLAARYPELRLYVIGRAKRTEEYWLSVEGLIKEKNLHDRVVLRNEFIPDEDIEVYFKAADLSVLPYAYVFQSGVLFVSYNFGIPVVATDVGSLREEIVEGETGYVCRPKDPDDLAEKIDTYFQSGLYRNLQEYRPRITAYAKEKYSWARIGAKTYDLYNKLLAKTKQ